MQYTATINWKRNDIPFTAKTYDRTHTVQFGGGTSIEGSAAPEFLGKAQLVNPEELFTSAISSCFMLTFLYLASMKGITVDSYNATATGMLAKNDEGKMAITEVTIKPDIQFEGEKPDSATLDELYKKAHDTCFISSSVKTKVTIV